MNIECAVFSLFVDSLDNFAIKTREISHPYFNQARVIKVINKKINITIIMIT